jgi:hypothetical protein
MEQTPEQKKKEYNKQRYIRDKEKMKESSKRLYIKSVSENPEYRTLLNERSKARHHKNKELNETPNRRRGRPRINVPKVKKANGRPRKYDKLNEVNS